MPLDLTTFAIKWQQTQLTEKSAYQQHFRDLCEALGVPHPTEEDVVGNNYTFEKHVTKAGGGSGYADVWKRDAFAWEYKLPGGDLNKAYSQLTQYHEDLGNPPLLVVCDFKRFEVHTKFDSQRSRVYSFSLEELRLNQPVPTSAVLPQDVLRYVFGDRNQLRPEAVTERVTREAAGDLLRLAQQLELERAASPTPNTREQVAHFLIRIVFCLFADSIGLLPDNVFRKLVQASHRSTVLFNRQLPKLFQAMSEEDVFFGADLIPWFNGGVFNGSATIELNQADCAILRTAAKRDWSQIEPSIFGTLFERSLDASKRSMIGAHYTSPEDILLLVEPVVMTPLRRGWAEARTAVETALEAEAAEPAINSPRRSLRANRAAETLLTEWAERLGTVRILDPACGSGNFLYVALKQMLDLWEEARVFGLKRGLKLPVETMPTPAQLFGIEIDFYAHEIASAVVWIGLLQWKRDHSYNDQPNPVLRKLNNIELGDAILRYDADGKPYEPEWPHAEYIVGNPPFLGDKMMRSEMGDEYVTDLRTLYSGRVPGGADLVTYWFERARAQIEQELTLRAGLIATNSIRMVRNRPVLERIKSTGDIFMAWSDNPWVLAGAAVRISIVAFDNGEETARTLNGAAVEAIHADLSSASDVSKALPLRENANLCFLGIMKGGPFDLSAEQALKMLSRPRNPNGRKNSDVVKRRIGGQDVTGRDRGGWIVDFGTKMTEHDAALYEWPFEYVKTHVKPLRDTNRRARMKRLWWLHGESRPGMRHAVEPLTRSIVTPEVSKYRVFAWMDTSILPDHKLHVIARQDDYFFGVLQSRLHEGWTIATCSWIGKGNDPSYNSATTFATFPFPYSPGIEPSEADSPIVRAIAEAARELVRLRDAWLNPPGSSEEDLKTRTLTRLYNARPEWLANAHRTLDRAVFAAYGWPDDLPDQEILARLLALNHERAAAEAKLPASGRSGRKEKPVLTAGSQPE